MAKYREQSVRDQLRINAIQAARLKRKYDSETIKNIASAYEVAYDRMQSLGENEECAIRRVLKGKGIDFGKGIKNWSYQVRLAKKIIQGEYGGLPQERQTSNDDQQSRGNHDNLENRAETCEQLDLL